MIIRGLRGVGKTALLNIFEDQAENAGFLTFYHELTPQTGLVGEARPRHPDGSALSPEAHGEDAREDPRRARSAAVDQAHGS